MTFPVLLAPTFPDALQAGMGRLMFSPGDLAMATELVRIFPGITVSVPMTSGDVAKGSFQSLEQLVPRLARCALVVNYAGGVPLPLDLLCAVLGVPYAGPSPLWPEIAADSPFRAVRALLTDQGLSEWRRQVAADRAAKLVGPQRVEEIRALALADARDQSAAPVSIVHLDGLKEPTRDLVRQMLGLLAGDSEREQAFETRAQAFSSPRFDAEAEEIIALFMERCTQQSLHHRRPLALGYFAPLEQIQAIRMETRVCRPDYVACTVSTTDDRARIQFTVCAVTGPARIEPELRFVAATQSFLVKDLPGRLSDNGKLTLIRSLVSAGILILEPSTDKAS